MNNLMKKLMISPRAWAIPVLLTLLASGCGTQPTPTATSAPPPPATPTQITVLDKVIALTSEIPALQEGQTLSVEVSQLGGGTVAIETERGIAFWGEEEEMNALVVQAMDDENKRVSATRLENSEIRAEDADGYLYKLRENGGEVLPGAEALLKQLELWNEEMRVSPEKVDEFLAVVNADGLLQLYQWSSDAGGYKWLEGSVGEEGEAKNAVLAIGENILLPVPPIEGVIQKNEQGVWEVSGESDKYKLVVNEDGASRWDKVVEDKWTKGESGLWTNPSEMQVYGEVIEVNDEAGLIDLARQIMFFQQKATGHTQFRSYASYEQWVADVKSGRFVEIDNYYQIDRNQKMNLGMTGRMSESGQSVWVDEVGVRIIVGPDMSEMWNLIDNGFTSRFGLTVEEVDGKPIYILNVAGYGVGDRVLADFDPNAKFVELGLSDEKSKEDNVIVINQVLSIIKERMRLLLKDEKASGYQYASDNVLSFYPKISKLPYIYNGELAIDEWVK